LKSITHIFIERELNHPQTLDLLSLPAQIPLIPVDDVHSVFAQINAAPDPIAAGKSTLLIARNRGRFIRPCPGTREYTCCGYTILNVANFCSMDCAYCILQTYFHPPLLQLYVNYEDLESELASAFVRREFRRIGTGEFSDSLIWEDICGISARLVKRFARQAHAVLELKTKSARIQTLAGLEHNRRTIVSWSLNSPAVIRANERGTASLTARLKAARECERWGYPLAFHLDPLVLYDGWREDYRSVVQLLFQYVSPHNIAWISMGSLRYMPSLKPVMIKRFPESTIAYGEMITGLDGKQRYFKPLRIELYQRLAEWFRHYDPDLCLYLCMEDTEVWTRSLGLTLSAEGDLARMLDNSAIRVCGLNEPGVSG
jgi:spore photoproduct lyase